MYVCVCVCVRVCVGVDSCLVDISSPCRGDGDLFQKTYFLLVHFPCTSFVFVCCNFAENGGRCRKGKSASTTSRSSATTKYVLIINIYILAEVAYCLMTESKKFERF